MSTKPAIFTFGHGKQQNAPFQAVVSALDAERVDRIIDVRAKPTSGYNPAFSRQKLEAALGNRYEWHGATLGNATYFKLPPIPVEKYEAAIAALVRRSAAGEMLALMCSETDWKKCHRHDPIALDLLAAGAEVIHLVPVDGKWADGVLRSKAGAAQGRPARVAIQTGSAAVPVSAPACS